MFIRLKRRLVIAPAPWFFEEYTLDAVLVKSFRKNGKPRQKFIKHLAQIRAQDLSHTEQLKRFWLQVEQQLKILALKPEIEQDLIKNLREKINSLQHRSAYSN
jgi:hypothetical protein